MQILSVNDDEFKKYGRVVDNVDFTELIQELKRTQYHQVLYMNQQ